MPRQMIRGWLDNPDELELWEYSPDLPEGEWLAELVWLAWGKSRNLFCYFTNLETNKRYRLSVFAMLWPNADKSYRAQKGGPPMDEQPLGSRFRLTTGKNSRGSPALFLAEPILHDAPRDKGTMNG